jgi:hypothetical protein
MPAARPDRIQNARAEIQGDGVKEKPLRIP